MPREARARRAVDGEHRQALRIAEFGIADAPAAGETKDAGVAVDCCCRLFRSDDAIHR